MFALASDSKSVISINISLEVIPANNDTTRYINGLFLIICKESPFPPYVVLNTSQAANPLVIGLIATNTAQLQFLINVRGFKCTVYKYVTIAPLISRPRRAIIDELQAGGAGGRSEPWSMDVDVGGWVIFFV
jgi:hypothetical protein